MISDERRTEIDAEIELEIADAVEFAEIQSLPRNRQAVYECLRRRVINAS